MAVIANASVASSPEATSGGAVADNAAFLFEMIVTDTHWTSMQIATLCLMATYSMGQGAKWTLRSCRHILSDDTRVMRLALRYGAEVGLSAALQNRLDGLYAELSELQKRSAPLAESDTPSQAQRELLQRLLPHWRKIALATAEALAQLEPVARTRLHPNFSADAITIRDFLRRASGGDLSDMDRFGVVHSPRLKQRRQSPRVAVKKNCRIVSLQGEFPAEVVDVSREGLGLVGAALIEPQQNIAVLLEDGRRLEGAVVHKQGQQIGVLLTRKLSFTDPLFQGG
jgi:hypothetical protein